MTAAVVHPAPGGHRATAPGAAALVRKAVEGLGGRYSTGLGIDVDAGDTEVERWFLAATLFGTRITAAVAERTFRVLSGAGLDRLEPIRRAAWDDLVELLDRGGYTRYDFRTATRLQALAEVVADRHDGEVAAIGRRFPAYPALHEALDALPGWGPVTVGLFLREMRGVWPGAAPPLDARVSGAARHLGLLPPAGGPDPLGRLAELAAAGGVDPRDLEAALVRAALAHGTRMGMCPGGPGCTLLGGSVR